MDWLSVAYTGLIIAIIMMVVITRGKFNRQYNYDHVLYKLTVPKWKKIFVFICYMVLIGGIIFLIYSIFIANCSYFKIIQLIFLLLILILNLNNLPTNYFVIDEGIIYYGLTKRRSCIYSWDIIEKAQLSKETKLKLYLNRNGVKFSVGLIIKDKNNENIINYLEQYVKIER